MVSLINYKKTGVVNMEKLTEARLKDVKKKEFSLKNQLYKNKPPN